MMPLGIRCSAVFTPLITSVWPALWPPWKRTTPWAISVSQSTSLPLPSSPHWVPTTTTLRPVVLFMTEGIRKKERRSEGAHDPAIVLGDQFAVAVELVHLVPMPGQRADHGLAGGAQARDFGAQRLLLAPGRADGGLQGALGHDADQFLD